MYNRALETSKDKKATHNSNQKALARERLDGYRLYNKAHPKKEKANA